MKNKRTTEARYLVTNWVSLTFKCNWQKISKMSYVHKTWEWEIAWREWERGCENATPVPITLILIPMLTSNT